MKTKAWTSLVGRYESALRTYVARGRKEALQPANELGGKVLKLGLGVVDVTRLQATRVKIRLRQLPRAGCMEIADHGRASALPSPANLATRQPLGIRGLQERLRLVNGQFAIESVPQRGTTVRVKTPLPHPDPTSPATRREPAPFASN